MRLGIRRSDYLIASQVLISISLTWALLVAFDALGAFINELDEIGEGAYSLATALLYVVLTVPRRAYELLPFAALIGSVLGLGGLSASSEITALRAAGLARWRIAMAAAMTVCVLVVVMVISAESLGPAGDTRAQALVVAAKSDDLAVSTRSGIWAREGDVFLNAKRGALQGAGAMAKLVLEDLRLYEFDQDGALKSIAHAGTAEHVGGNWVLLDVRRTRFGERSVEASHLDREVWKSKLNPELLSFSMMRPRYLAYRDLSEMSAYLTRNGLDASAFEGARWSRLFYAFNILIMCVAVMPFAFGSLRSGGFGKRLFVGIAAGLCFFTVQNLSVSMASVYHIHFALAHGLPSLLLVGLGLLFMRVRRRLAR